MRLTTALACTTFFSGHPKRGQAIPNPASVNCVDQSYTEQTLYTPDGGQYGLCVFSNDTACDEWAYFRGECNTTNPDFALYCADNGGEVSQENVDWGDVQGAPPATYEVCTADGVQCTDWDYYSNNNCSFASSMLGQPIDGCSGVPASCKCSDDGYTVSPTLYDPTGGEYALCIFSNDTACDEWAYFRGECNTTNPNFALYCADNGGEVSQENVDWGDVEGALPATYEVCTTDGVECTEYNYYDSRCKQVVTTTIAPSSLGGVGIPNPASTGCAENGGSSESMYQADGGQYGVCIFPDGTACEEWALERGECAKGTKPVFSTYCADTGGEMSEENVDWGSTEGAPPATYEVCTINGAQCAAEYYYTSGCANFNATSPTLVAGADPTSTPSGSNGLSHGIVASLLVISIHIFAFGIGILV